MLFVGGEMERTGLYDAGGGGKEIYNHPLTQFFTNCDMEYR